MVPVIGLDHVVLRVRDLDAMLDFYRDTLGCPVERTLDIGLVQLRAGSSLIDLVPVDSELGRTGGGPPDGPRNMDHFCLQVEPFDEDVIRRTLASRGYGHCAAGTGGRGEEATIQRMSNSMPADSRPQQESGETWRPTPRRSGIAGGAMAPT